jgi:MFS family permease
VRFAALRAPWYKGYLTGGSLLMGGDQVEHAITYLAMWQLFHSPLLAGFAVVSHWLPHLLFSVTFGALADKYDCRRLIQIGAGLFVIATLGWAVTLGLGILQPWMCMVLLVIHGLASAVWQPANQVMLYDIVGAETLPSAVRLMATGLQIGMLVGPAVGAVLLFTVGPVWGLVLNVLLYAPFIVYLFVVPFDGHSRARRAVTRIGLGDTLRVLRELPKYPTVLALVVLQGAVAMLFGTALATLLPAFGDVLGVGESGLGYGLLLIATAIGAVAGGLALESAARIRPTLRLAVGSTIVLALSIVVFALSGSFAVALPALVVAGVASIVSASTSQSIVQLEAPDDQRGRFVGVYGTTSMGLRIVSGLLVGGIAGGLGVQLGVAIPAVALALVSITLLAVTTGRGVRSSRSARS